MDTVVSLQVYTDSPVQANQAFVLAKDSMAALEGILSAHLPGSDLAKIAEKTGEGPITVHESTFFLVTEGLKYAALSQGAFDLTIGPLLDVYGFSTDSPHKPEPAELSRALALVDWRQVSVDGDHQGIGLPQQGMALDLGAIAKGYIVDHCLTLLQSRGIEFGFVNAGGDIGFLGTKPDGSSWRVGLKNPDNPSENFATVEIAGGAIATSGDYERYFFEGDRRYHHILDPRTGAPAAQSRSVTIIAGSAYLADLLATTVFVLGPESGLALIENLPDVEGIIWDAENKVHWSSGLVNEPSDSAVPYYFRRP